MTQTQDLSFGTFTFVSFDSTSTIIIQNNGDIDTNGNVVPIVNGTRAEFSLTGGAANSVYTITTPTGFTLSGPGGNFNIDDIRVTPNTLQTDATGADDFQIAARLTSLGGGTIYNNGVYNNTFDIIISF